MRAIRLLLLTGLLGVSAVARAGDGLTWPGLDADASPLRARISLSVTSSALISASDSLDASAGKRVQLQSATLLGDYYFRTPWFDGSSALRGFRATSGLVIGTPNYALAATSPLGRNATSLSLGRVQGALGQGADPASDSGGAVPYLGFGYSGLIARSGWGISADLGLVAQNPGGSVRLGHAFNGTMPLDDALHELRLSPVLQLGVSYSF